MKTNLPPQYAYRADAGEAAYVERALLYVETETYNYEFPPLEGRKYVPYDTSSNPGAKATSYKQYTRVGIAKLHTERGNDLPNVKLFVREFFHQYYRIGCSYEYTLDDLLAAQFSSQNGGPKLDLDLEQGQAARTAIERGLDVISAIGSTNSASIPGLSVGIGPDVGLLGLLNQPNATVYTPAVSLAAGTTPWQYKSPDEKVADLTGLFTAVIATTFKTFQVNTVLLPIQQFYAANGQRMGDGSDETVLSFFRKINPAMVIDCWQYCAGAGIGGTDRAVGYVRDRRYVRHMISDEFRQMPPEWSNLTFSVDCTAKTAGVVCPYPLAICYMDGI